MTSSRTAAPSTAWDTRAPVRVGQGMLVTIGLLTMIPALIASALYLVPPVDDAPALLASFIPYGLVFWVPTAVLLGIATVRARNRRGWSKPALVALSLVALAGLLATIAWQLPAYLPDREPVTTDRVRVVSLNVHGGRADPAEVSREVSGADVVAFAEATPEWVAALPEGFRDELPYGSGAPLQDDAGSVIFSRYPISSSEALPASSFQQWSAVVDTPQVGRLRVVAVHPCNPFCGPGMWPTEHAQLRHWLARQDDTPTVVAGDFNAVDEHGPMRRLYADGWRSAADLAGAGFVPTYPGNRAIPPLIGIDHILVNDRLTALDFETFRVRWTDHLGVRAVIAGTTGTAPPG